MFEKVTYRCGHEGEIEVYGKADKRNYVVSMKERGGVRQGAGRKKLLESEKIQKKQVSLEITIVEFEKLTDHCTANNTSKNALLKDLLKKEDII